MKVTNGQVLHGISINKQNKTGAVSNPNAKQNVSADKVFYNLSFGAAIAQAMLKMQDKNNAEKSGIDDAVSSILSDIKKGGLKTGCTEREELENAKDFIFKILDKYLGGDEKYIEEKNEYGIELQDTSDLLRKKELHLSAEEKEYLSSCLKKYDNNKWYADKTLSDTALVVNTSYVIENTLEEYDRPLNDIFHVMRCIQDNHQLPQEMFNSGAVFKNFKENIAPCLSLDELRIVHDILCSVHQPFDKENIQKEIDTASFDYRKLSQRRLSSFIEENNRSRIDYYKEFLFCSDDEFKEKITRLDKRMFLKQTLNSKDVPFVLWKQLFDMDEAEYEKLAVPFEQRPAETFDAEKYTEEIKTKISEPFEFDRDEIQKLLDDNFFIDFGRTYDFDKINDFVKFEPKNEQVSLLPSADDIMKKLKAYNRISLNIPDKGGANPVNEEKADIKHDDEAKLGKIENAGIKIKYGEKINWSDFKIARDIMQNFYDGNGHTLEGVKLKAVKNSDGSYKIRIEGLGKYDYSHLASLGDSTKDDDALAAGSFGEGTRIIAVNLLSKLDTNSVKYGSGDWSMEFKRSSDDIKTADMTQVLTKNETRINGNYIEFNTKNEDLVKTVLDSKDYFYHPYNPDFQNLDYENEYFGIKILPQDGQSGNLYLVQRYEHNGLNKNSLHNISLIFKKMPNDPELVRLNGGEEYTANTGRDRVEISTQTLRALFSRYIKTMKDEDLTKLICTLEPFFNTESREEYTYWDITTQLLAAALDETENRRLGIKFENYVCVNDKEDEKRAQIMGYKTAIAAMKKAGMSDFIKDKEKIPFEKPNEILTEKIRLLNEAVRVFEECADLSTIDIISPGEADTPKYPYKTEEGDNIKAEAITENGVYKGHWVKTAAFVFDNYNSNLATWLHELSHKSGGDGTEPFAEQLKKMQQFIINTLVHNPSALNKIKILAELYNNEKLPENTAFDEKGYEAQMKSRLENLPAYTEFIDGVEKSDNMNAYDTLMLSMNPDYKPKEKHVINAVYKKREKELQNAPVSILPNTGALMETLAEKGRVSIDIQDKGGAHPVKTEKALIKKDDEANLGRTESAKIKIRYGEKINWGSFKIARDIMQNFYDGNGHTLEGVKLNVIKTDSGKYKIRIEGLGTYDYSHLQSIGDSTKDNDYSAAGNFGEGTRILAVNLLSKLDTNSVKYGSGDWSMEFKRNSDDIKTADMMQTLTKNNERIDGNYIEFDTEDEELVKTVLDSKDYFYHPDNPDFQNLDFENEFFGFRVQKDKGNIYYIQRYQTADRRGLNGLNIVFKQQQNAVKEYLENRTAQETEETAAALKPEQGGILSGIKGLFSKKQQFLQSTGKKFDSLKISFEDFDIGFLNPAAGSKDINTGRDRNALEARDIKSLAFKYAKTMKDDEIISAIESFEPLLAGDKPDTPEINRDNNDSVYAFMSGIIKEAGNRNIKFNSKDAKIVYINKSDRIPGNVQHWLKEHGYKFGNEIYSEIGLKSAKNLYNDEHKKHSIKPSKEEAQKLEILNAALKLFKENDNYSYLPDISENPVYLYEKGEDINNRDYHAVYSGGRFKAVLIDKETLAKDSFMEALTRVISEVPRKEDNFSMKYTYDLTDLIRLELDSLVKNPETAQKLKMLEKLYNRV